MITAEPEERRVTLKDRLIERLRNPTQLRIFVTAAVLLAGILGVYMPLDSSIADTTAKLAKTQTLSVLARDVEHLRKQYHAFEKRLPKQKDSKEWVAYVLNGIRKFPLKLNGMDCEKARPLGPYTAVVLRIELEGGFHDMDDFLRWIEANERMFRVDVIRIAPSRSNKDVMVMQCTVLGVMG